MSGITGDLHTIMGLGQFGRTFFHVDGTIDTAVYT